MESEPDKVEPGDWDTLLERLLALPAAKAGRALALVVADIGRRADELERLCALAGDHAGFDRRMAALEAARKHVSELPTEKENPRGYRDKALSPADRVAQELRVARYLLGEESF